MPDPDGVARTTEAIEAVWSDAVRRAVEFRETQPAPTCARCGLTDWLVAITEPDGRQLHVECWKAETSKDAILDAAGALSPPAEVPAKPWTT